MSYINEALKKAQELKDSGYPKYYDIPLSGSGVNRRSGTGIFYYSASAVVLILLIFSAYGWMHFLHNKGEKAATDVGDKGPSGFIGPAPDKKDLYNKAMSLFNEGRINDAKKLYEAVVALYPGYIEALNNLSIIYIRENDFNAAEDCLKKAVRLNQSYVEAYYNLACLYALKGDIDRGLACLERSILLNGEVREWAKNDSDLRTLRSSEKYKKLVNFHPIQ